MADFYTYRNEFARRRRKRRLVLIALILLALLCAVAGLFWQQREKAAGGEEPVVAATPAATIAATQEAAVTPQPTPQTGKAPERIVQAVDTAIWNTAAPVAQTIDAEYLNTDHRMIGVPMLGTVTNDYFNTVTFVGDSIASGLGIYQTGLPNAKFATYTSAGVNSFVNNMTMNNAVTKVDETPMEAIVASQPDYVYILVGTNNLVTQGNEESFLAYYERFIDMLREQLNPGVILYIQAIPGVQETVVQTKPGLDNARIATVNDLLANLALRKGCYFVNIREVLTNPADGSQVDDYQVTDGVHFNASGYRVWAEYLATHTVWNRRSQYSGQNPYYIYGA